MLISTLKASSKNLQLPNPFAFVFAVFFEEKLAGVSIKKIFVATTKAKSDYNSRL